MRDIWRGHKADIGARVGPVFGWQTDSRIGEIHHFLATSTDRDADVAKRSALEPEPGSLAVFRTAHIAQLLLSRLLEPFDAYSVEVREHRQHSNTELLQTKNQVPVGLRGGWQAEGSACPTSIVLGLTVAHPQTFG